MCNLLSITESAQSFINLVLQELGVWYYIIVNAFGVGAIIFKVSETQLKYRGLIITFAACSSGCWVLYYLLNANLTSALISFIAIVKYVIFFQREKHKWANSVWWLYFFIAVQLVVCAFTYKDLTSILSTSAGLLGTFAYFTISPKKYRYTLLFCQLCWVANGLINLYYVALLSDLIATISIIAAIIRFTITEKNKK